MATSSIYAQLHAPIETLGFSQGFVKQCRKRHYRHLQDIVDKGRERLLADPDIDLPWFSELTEYLSEHFLLHLLDSKTK
ncbi:hypothetical protein [Olivibacter sitiensis]|uniref:hypothetical protein n=1 Tax=Olivibacter sitiensis TaxID=376470 RepID=UPI000418B1B8|nr:hypothetical protein [Olivibacter sitiensis]